MSPVSQGPQRIIGAPDFEYDTLAKPHTQRAGSVRPTKLLALDDLLLTDLVREGAKAIAEMLPGIGFAMRVREERNYERRIRLLEFAIEELGSKTSDFDDRLHSDEDLAELVGRAWDVVAEARSNAKIRLLANVVAAAVRGEHLTVSAGHVVLDVISRLQPLHLKVLVDNDQESKSLPPTGPTGEVEPTGTRREALQIRSQVDPDVLSIMIADLVATQLIVNRYANTWGSFAGQEAWTLTQLGLQVQELLNGVAGKAEQS